MMKKTTPLQSIRQKCLDCSCWQPTEVRFCAATGCPLHPYRFGTNPARKGIGPGHDTFTEKTFTESSKTNKSEVLND